MTKFTSVFHNSLHKTGLSLGLAIPVVACLALAQPAFADNYDIGLKLYGEQNYEMASRYFLEAAGQSDNPNVHYYLADTYLKLDRFAEAQAEYQKVLAIAPDSQAAKLSKVGLAHLREFLNGTRQTRWTQTGIHDKTPIADRYSGAPINGEDYLDDVTEAGKMVRWSLKTMPLKVFIESSPMGIRNFQPAYISQVRRALDVWANVLDHQVSFVPTTNRDQAQFRISWVNTIDSKGHTEDGGTAYTAGLTIPRINSDQLAYMDIKLATFDIQGHPQDADTIYAVSVHEFGHAMGLLGHSSNPEDIMFARNENVIIPSKRDTNTIRKLYSSVADIDNLPPDTHKVDPEREKELQAKRDKDITRLEAQAKKDDTALSWLNLSVAYYLKARSLGYETDDRKPWLKKALDASTNAIQREPKNAINYHKRSLVYQEYPDYPHALQDIQQALALNHQEPEYYMLQSWFMANLGQMGQAKSSLNTYLLYKPSEANSQDVIMIKNLLQQSAQQSSKEKS